jgi:hypothetical protein
MGLGIIIDAVRSKMETSQNEVSEAFPRQPLSSLSPCSDAGDAYVAAELID